MGDYPTLTKAYRTAAWAFYGMWACVALIVALFEINILPVGWLNHTSRGVYYTQIVITLLTIFAIPLSLKYFHLYTRKLDAHDNAALYKYMRASMWRLGALALPLFLNLTLYYLTLNRAPGYMTLIVLLATIFCLPDRKQMQAIHDEANQH